MLFRSTGLMVTTEKGHGPDRWCGMQLVDATVRKRAAPECRYAVVDADGRIALIGLSLPREDLTFAVELDGRLPAGQYTVMAEILVNGNAMNSEIERIPVVIGRKP